MLRIALRPSLQLGLALAGAHVAAALLLLTLEVSAWAKLALLALIASSLVHALLSHALRCSRGSVVAIELGENDNAKVRRGDGNWQEARLLPTTYVSPFLSIINLRMPRHIFARHIVIVPDSLHREDFRRLRAWLLWQYRRDN